MQNWEVRHHKRIRARTCIKKKLVALLPVCPTHKLDFIALNVKSKKAININQVPSKQHS